jgi:hypothetical protein
MMMAMPDNHTAILCQANIAAHQLASCMVQNICVDAAGT